MKSYADLRVRIADLHQAAAQSSSNQAESDKFKRQAQYLSHRALLAGGILFYLGKKIDCKLLLKSHLCIRPGSQARK